MEDFEKKTLVDPANPGSGDTVENRIFPANTVIPASGFRMFYSNNKWYFWAIFAALIIIGSLAFFAFRKSPIEPTKEANVNLAIDLPEILPSSGDFIFRVKIENKDPAKLVNMNLEVVYPEGVDYVSSSPEAKESLGANYEIPDLVSNQNAVVTIKAHMQGGINDTKEISARLRYRYENFNSNFEKKASAQTRLSASDISLEMDGPTQITPSQIAVYEIKYTNNSENDIKNARIQLDYPDGFTFSQAEPATDVGKNVWNVSSLKQGESGSVKITGNFSGSNSGESKTLSAQFLVLDGSGTFFPQAKTEYTTQISGLPLMVTQSLEQSNSGIAAPGDTLSYKIHYQNNGQTPARGVNIVVNLESKALDLNSIQAENAQVSGGTITWNAANDGDLETVSPASGGDLRFTVDIKDPAVKDTSKNVSVKSSIKIQSDGYDTFLPGNTLETKISTQSKVVGSVAYVSGSLPPKVGKDTVYRISLSLRNSTNDISGTQLVAYIPFDPSSFDSSTVTAQESSKVTFDKATGKLIWNPGTIAAHTGDFSPPRVLQFNLRLKPTSVQAGSQVTLLRNIAVSAKDVYTNQTIRFTAEDLTTRSVPDAEYNNTGTVIK